MKTDNQPRVLIVDDQEDDRAEALIRELNQRSFVKASLFHPDELTLNIVRDADLVLVDFILRSWPERSQLGEQIALQPSDGIALTSVLRRHISDLDRASPTAFAIYTGQLAALAKPLPPENRCHILSRLTNAEWVFEKYEQNLSERVETLARSVRQLPRTWSDDGRLELSRLLGLDNLEESNAELVEQLIEDVYDCLPPVHEMSEWSHGLAFIRWLLHRILPYPCFLWTDLQVASRLQISPPVAANLLADESPLHKALRDSEYTGMLANFAGNRWWRRGIEAILWKQTDGRSFDPTAVREFVSNIAGKENMEQRAISHPAVIYNSYLEQFDIASADSAVRVRPDDWPAFADHAWVSEELARSDPRMHSIVIEQDRERISD